MMRNFNRAGPSRLAGSVYFTFPFLGGMALAHGDGSDGDGNGSGWSGGSKGYKFDNESNGSKWNEGGDNGGGDDGNNENDGQWHDDGNDGKWNGDTGSSASASEAWSQTHSVTAYPTHTHGRGASSTPASSLSNTEESISSTISSTLVPSSSASPSMMTDQTPPSPSHLNPVAIALPLAICGLIGFIALMVCMTRRSQRNKRDSRRDPEKDWQALLQQKLLESSVKPAAVVEEKAETSGVTVTKREEEKLLTPVYYRELTSEDRPPMYEGAQQLYRGERRYSARDDCLVLERSRDHSLRQTRSSRPSNDSRYGWSIPTSRSDTCMTPNTADRFTYIPRRGKSRMDDLYQSRYSRSTRHDAPSRIIHDYYSPVRRSSSGRHSEKGCSCSHRSEDLQYRSKSSVPLLSRLPSFESRSERSIVNPHPKHHLGEPLDRHRTEYHSSHFPLLRSSIHRAHDEYWFDKQRQSRDVMERQYTSSTASRDQPIPRGHMDDLYEDLRRALQTPR